MKNLHRLLLLALGVSGVLTASLQAQVILRTDFSDGTTQGWAQKTTPADTYASFGVSQIASDPDRYALRIDDTVRTTENASGAPSATISFERQDSGVIQQSMSIRFLNSGGLGSRYGTDIRVSVNGVGTGTYIRFKVGEQIQFYSSNTTQHFGDLVLEYGVWYDLVQTVDLATSTYSFTLQSQSDPAVFYQSPNVRTYYTVTYLEKMGIFNVGGRQGLYEIADVSLAVIPEPSVGVLGFSILGVIGAMKICRRRRSLGC